MQACLGGGKPTPHPLLGIARQNDRAMQERGCRGQAAARLRAAGGLLERRGELRVGPAAAVARCHARRSGTTLRSVASARARWISRRCSLVAVRYTAERTSGRRKVTRWLRARSPSVSASTAETAMPSCSEARSRSSGSPMGSAAASSNRRRASSETALIVVRSAPGSGPTLLAPLAARSLQPAAPPSIRVATRATPTDFRASPR